MSKDPNVRAGRQELAQFPGFHCLQILRIIFPHRPTMVVHKNKLEIFLGLFFMHHHTVPWIIICDIFVTCRDSDRHGQDVQRFRDTGRGGAKEEYMIGGLGEGPDTQET